MKQSKSKMLQYIDSISFAVTEAGLYLDTHPCDQEALDYFRHYSRLRDKALKEYAAAYGPLTLDTNANQYQTWEWINSPWPWEVGGEC